MKKFLFILMIMIILVSALTVVYFNSNYYYSKKLVAAIQDEDILAVQNILNKKRSCINTYPSITSKWWHSAMNWRICYPLNVACATGNLELITLLLENGADPNCNDGLTPLSVTYSLKLENWYTVATLLIQNGATLDYTTEYSGKYASIFGDIVTTRSKVMVSSYGPESSEEVMAAFQYALKNCDHSNVKWFIVLQDSITNNRIEIVKLLLDHGYCDVNDSSSSGMTPLMFAAMNSDVEMVKLLLEYGADVGAKTLEGETAYDHAIQYGKDDVKAFFKSLS